MFDDPKPLNSGTSFAVDVEGTAAGPSIAEEDSVGGGVTGGGEATLLTLAVARRVAGVAVLPF